jgi:hypothetical protein
MKMINVKVKRPNNNQYVLVHLIKDNWGDDDDPDGNRYFKVVKFIRGISTEERDKLLDSDQRKVTYRSGDEGGNNKVPYTWNEFGPGSYFGQEVDYWMELSPPW